MGLIITNEINTDGGSTSTSYLNISSFKVDKDSDTRVFLNLYLSKEAKDANPRDTVSSQVIIKRFGISPEDFDTSNVYTSLYSRLRTILEEAGFTVEDDI
jgi:hypothetical protein